MAILAMAVYATEANGRATYTRRTLDALQATVDWSRHRLVISDNGSSLEAQELFQLAQAYGHTVLHNGRNLGTAMAINRAWRLRRPGEHCVKMDDDVTIQQVGWLDVLEDAVRREPRIGICGLKRKDLEERPGHPNPWYTSSLHYLPQHPGERCIIIERVNHVMGTCQLYSAALLAKIGYLYQGQDEGNLYGYDDSLAAVRAWRAGFWCVFVPSIEIDHIDPGGTSYTAWKTSVSGAWMARYNQIKAEYESGQRPVYWEDPQ